MKSASQIVWLVQPRPEKGGNHHRSQQQHPSHRRRAGLAPVQIRQLAHLLLRPDRLPHLEADQPTDHPVAKHQRQQEGGHRRRDGAERDVLENIQRRPRSPPVIDEVHHVRASSSTMVSIFTDRLPLISTVSPFRAMLRNTAAASSVVPGVSACRTPMLARRRRDARRDFPHGDDAIDLLPRRGLPHPPVPMFGFHSQFIHLPQHRDLSPRHLPKRLQRRHHRVRVRVIRIVQDGNPPHHLPLHPPPGELCPQQPMHAGLQFHAIFEAHRHGQHGIPHHVTPRRA